MALAAARMNPEHREILLRDKPAQMLEISPKGTVPVLLTHGGMVLDESFDIMLHALETRDPHGWLRNVDCAERRALLNTNDGSFKTALDRYKYASRAGQDLVAAALDEAAIMLQRIEGAMAGAPFIDGRSMGLFDAAISPFVRQLAGVDRARFEAIAPPAVLAWLQTMVESAAFKNVMAKVPLWRAGDDPRMFAGTLAAHAPSP